MKSKIIIFMLFFSLPVFGQLKPKFSFDYFMGNYDIKIVTPILIDENLQEYSAKMDYGNFRVRIGADYEFKHFSVYFDQSIFMNKSKNITFQPLQAEWYAGAKIKIYKKIYFQYEHMCVHPIISNNTFEKQSKIYGGYNMLSISYGY